MGDGLCECGCGRPAPIATRTDRQWGWVKGQPKRFINGHQNDWQRGRSVKTRWIEDPATGCWMWQLSLNPKTGYGRVRARGAGEYLMAHRWMYEQHVGPIPDGYDIDHLCRNRACVNPAHLEAVTERENAYRRLTTTLSDDDVRLIAERIRSGEWDQNAAADHFGVSQSAISKRLRRMFGDDRPRAPRRGGRPKNS